MGADFRSRRRADRPLDPKCGLAYRARRSAFELQFTIRNGRVGPCTAPPVCGPLRCGRGYGSLYQEQITLADTGCDFAFLVRQGQVPDPYAG